MKKLFLVGIIMLVFIPGVFAKFRIDFAIDVPAVIGISNSDLDDESINLLLDLGTFPIPEALFASQSSIGDVKIGAGFRVVSLIVESFAWPHVYAEIDLSNIVINAGIGGGAFLLFGLYNRVAILDLLIPDINIAYKFGDTFRLGVGALSLNSTYFNEDITPYAIYLTGRFSMIND